MAGEGRSTRKVLTLLVELRCNSYCVFCGQREVDEAVVRTRRRLGLLVPPTRFGALRGRYTLETATEALRRARDEGYTELSLQGGEPTIFPDLVPLVREARALGFDPIGIVTNGRKLKDRSYTEALLGAGLDGISVSLLGPDAETHDAIAAAPGAFDAMVEGLRHASAIARARGRRVTVSASVITHARNVDRLADQVRLLAGLGVEVASLHLVRFEGLGDDPGVREPLRFDLRRLRAPLAEAMAEGERLGLRLHAPDLPLCVQPRLAAGELERLVARAAIARHGYTAAAYSFDASEADGLRGGLPSCSACLVSATCPRAPTEYLPPDAPDVLVPITPESVDAEVTSVLAALDPEDPAAPERLRDLDRAIALLAGLAGRPLDGAATRVREALGDLMVLAARRRDGAGMTAAFTAWLGLRPVAIFRADPRAWSLVTLPAAELARRTGAAAEDAAPGDHRLVFGDTFTIRVESAARDGATVDVTRATPVLAPAEGAAARVARALFLLFVAEPLRSARAIRVADETLAVDRGDGFATVWATSRPGALRLEPAHARVADGDA